MTRTTGAGFTQTESAPRGAIGDRDRFAVRGFWEQWFSGPERPFPTVPNGEQWNTTRDAMQEDEEPVKSDSNGDRQGCPSYTGDRQRCPSYTGDQQGCPPYTEHDNEKQQPASPPLGSNRPFPTVPNGSNGDGNGSRARRQNK